MTSPEYVNYNRIENTGGLRSHPDGTWESGAKAWSSGIYFDDGTSNMVAIGNLIYNAPNGFLVHGGYNVKMTNNVIVPGPNSSHSFQLQPVSGVTMSNNVISNNIADNSTWGPNPKYAVVSDNFYFGGTKNPANDTTSKVADPLFTNPALGDYSLQKGSPAFGLGCLAPARGPVLD